MKSKKTFECHPSVDDTFNEIVKIYSGFENLNIVEKDIVNVNRTIINIESDALGDTIGAMSIINRWAEINSKNVSVICKYPDLFRNSYPNLVLYKRSKYECKYDSTSGTWEFDNLVYNEYINTKYKFETPLMKGYANDFNIDPNVKIKVDSVKKERPIKAKYVCIGVQSTSQCKYWNYPDGWNILCGMLRKKGLTPVCVEKDYSFGIVGSMNEVPSRSLKKIGMPFNDVINYIEHCEFFIGLSSGLSWLAQGLGKPTVIISNTTSKDNEYIDENTIRIYDETVCHGCFHKYPFNSGDWLWCPVYRNDNDRRFICTKAITPESVMSKIEEKYKI